MNNSKDALVNYYLAISNADLEKISTCFDLPAKMDIPLWCCRCVK